MQKINMGYRQMQAEYKKNRVLSPYLWRQRVAGQIRKNTKIGDVVYAKLLKKLALVEGLATTQLKVKFMNKSGIKPSEYIPKHDIINLLSGSIYVSPEIPPSHEVSTEVKITRGDEVERENGAGQI